MGVVYEALHLGLGRHVAVKTVLAEIGHDPKVTERFEREARASSAIGHPHIVDVFDLGRTPDGLLFMVMELLDGESLAEILKKTPRLEVALAVNLIGQVLGGLGAAHRAGIVHRDLKPENIVVINSEDRPNFVKILDFGISKILPPSMQGQGLLGQTRGTITGTIMGTPLYMSPEQVLGRTSAIDHRTDIYAAGVVLFEMLCGCTPFEDEDRIAVFARILDNHYPTPHSLRPDIPPDIEAAIVRALAPEKEDRFPTAAAMREAILGSSADLTPAPELMPVFIDTPPPESGPAKLIQPSSVPRDDVFGDQLESAAVNLVPEKREHTRGTLSSTAGLAAVRDERRHARLALARLRRAQRESEPLPGGRLRLVLLVALLFAAAGSALAYRIHHRATVAAAAANQRPQCRVAFALDPTEASVEIDHVPMMGDDLLDQDASHVIHIAAPGRIARRFTFEAKPGLVLSIHLERRLALPSASDPDALPTDPALTYPTTPASREQITHAYAKLEHYAQCLAPLLDADKDAGKDLGAAVPNGARMSRCVQVFDRASALTPDLPGLHKAGQTYLLGAHNGQPPPVLRQLLQRFAAEFLATRAAWQLEELARQEADDGRTAAWHMRRVALASLAWLRQASPPAATARGPTKPQAWLDESQRALLDFAEKDPQAMARTAGADAFTSAAENVMALARSHGGKRPNKTAALAACRQLVTAFNALVVD